MSVVDLQKIMEVKRYSESTIVTYCSFISKIEHELKRPINKLSETELQNYAYSQIHSKRISRSTQKQLVNALCHSFVGERDRYPHNPKMTRP